MPESITPIGPAGLGPIQPAQPVQPGLPAGAAGEAGGKSFSQFLSEKIGEVNQLQQESTQAIEGLATGKVQDLGKVVSAVEKANLAFQMMVQIRNKLVDAYDELQRIRT
ncbi:MAG TPA: flagellar hook-basal body complex protein FliE [Planctomycetota bacterium]|nr:flagellar hook-basal body complex protein FliE [Planctomycetota bacterium]